MKRLVIERWYESVKHVEVTCLTFKLNSMTSAEYRLHIEGLQRLSSVEKAEANPKVVYIDRKKDTKNFLEEVTGYLSQFFEVVVAED